MITDQTSDGIFPLKDKIEKIVKAGIRNDVDVESVWTNINNVYEIDRCKPKVCISVIVPVLFSILLDEQVFSDFGARAAFPQMRSIKKIVKKFMKWCLLLKKYARTISDILDILEIIEVQITGCPSLIKEIRVILLHMYRIGIVTVNSLRTWYFSCKNSEIKKEVEFFMKEEFPDPFSETSVAMWYKQSLGIITPMGFLKDSCVDDEIKIDNFVSNWLYIPEDYNSNNPGKNEI